MKKAGVDQDILTGKHDTRMDFMKTPPSDCKARSIIKFLTAKNKSGAKIRRRLWVVYDEEHIMNGRNVQWRQKVFKEEGTSSMLSTLHKSRWHKNHSEMYLFWTSDFPSVSF